MTDPVLAAIGALDAKLDALINEVRVLNERHDREKLGPAVTIERACELLQCSPARIYELLQEGRLRRAPRSVRRPSS